MFVLWVADWFAFVNNRVGSNLDKIQTMQNYLIEA